MTQDEIIEMPEYLNASYEGDDLYTGDQVRELVKLVAERERERIIAKNAPVIKQCNDYIQSLEDELAAIRARETKGNQDAKSN